MIQIAQTSRQVKSALSLLVWAALIPFAACTSAPKQPGTIDLDTLAGHTVALVSIDGESTAQKIVEVALINQLLHRGTFTLISKQELESARKDPTQDPTDWRGIAKRAGADYALRVQILKFEAPIYEGYSTREVRDSQLAEEQGTDGKTEQVYKVKAMEGHVKFELKWTHLTPGNKEIETRTTLAEAQERVEASAHNTSIHLPPPLRFLETLSNRAFSQTFGGY